jgi:hypothetical protein
VAGKTIDSFRDVWRCHHEYRVRTRELPRVCWLAIRVHLLEVAGMIAAFRERPLSATAYR